MKLKIRAWNGPSRRKRSQTNLYLLATLKSYQNQNKNNNLKTLKTLPYNSLPKRSGTRPTTSSKMMKHLVEEYEAILQKELGKLGENNTGEAKSVVHELADLNENDRKALFDALVENGKNKVEESSDARKVMKTIASSIQKTQSVVSSALSAYPPASIAWGATCLLLGPVFINNAEQTDARQSGLKYVISRFPWYTQLIDLLSTTTWNNPAELNSFRGTIRDEIISLYTSLIDYQLQSVHSFYHPLSSSGKNLVKWDDWDGTIDSIKKAEEKLKEYIQMYMTSISQKTFNDMNTKIGEISVSFQEQVNILRSIRDSGDDRTRLLERQENAMKRKEKEELMQKFKPDTSEFNLEIYQQYVSQIARPSDGTDKGVLQHPKFTEWAKGDSGILVLAAHHGTGKSVLAKHLLDELPTFKPTTVCSFFFKDNSNRNQNDPKTALCKILYEVLKACTTLDNTVERQARDLDKYEIQSDSNKYWNLLTAAIQNTPHERVTIAMDALDECDSEHISGLLSALISPAFGLHHFKIRVLLTTRPLPQILRGFKDSVLNLDDDPGCRESIRRDIIDVFNKRLEELCEENEVPEKTKREVFDRIITGNDRTYLFMELLFKYLERQGPQSSSKKWVQKFSDPPTDLFEAYTALLNSVESGQQCDVRKVLEMVIVAERPLTVREMGIALALQDDDVDCEEEEEDIGSTPNSFKKWILAACGFILDIYNDRIYFIHLTAEQFLLYSDDKPIWLRDLSIESCHETLAKSCMAYFSMPLIKKAGFMTVDDYVEVERSLRSENRRLCQSKFQFGEYAFSRWIVHLNGTYIAGEAAMLCDISYRYPDFQLGLAISTFCCSALPSHVEAKVFVDTLPMDYPGRVQMLIALGHSFDTRFEEGSEGLSGLDYAIHLVKQAVEQTPRENDRVVLTLASLSRRLGIKFDMTEDYSVLDEAIQVAKQAVILAFPGNPHRADALKAHGKLLLRRFATNEDDEDLTNAINDLTTALDLCPQQDPRRVGFLGNVALALGLRHWYSQQVEDINQAILKMEEALKLDPESGHSSNLSALFIQRYEDLQDIEDINQAVEVARKGAENSVFYFRSQCFDNLATGLKLRYDSTQNIEDLEEAFLAAQKSLYAISIENHKYPERLAHLRSLRGKLDNLKQSS